MKKIFRSFFKSNKKENDSEDASQDEYKYLPKKDELVEDKFTLNFSSNGGKFLYATNIDECEEFFIKILEENNWAKKSILCFNEDFTKNFIPSNNIKFNKSNINSNLFITDCEFLVAKDGSILVSAKQIQSYKSNDLPNNIIVMARTSQLSETLSFLSMSTSTLIKVYISLLSSISTLTWIKMDGGAREHLERKW